MSAGDEVANEGNGAADRVRSPRPSFHASRSRIDPAAEESALVAVSSGRSGDAVKILMRAYGDAITAFALRILRARDSAHDVRQQVFLDAFQGLGKFKGHGSAWSWLCGIAYHRCLDELRRSRRKPVVEDPNVLDQLVDQTDSSMNADQHAERRALELCLAELSPVMRSQLLMRYFLGLSYIEIGEIIRVPHSTVQVRISRILPRLRQCLRDKGVSR